MRVIALKDIPGARAGAVLETTDEIARVLVLVGAARAVEAEAPAAPKYKRRDLKAEG